MHFTYEIISNPFINAKYVECNYFLWPSKFEMKSFINKSNVKAVLLFWDILELLFLSHHNARFVSKRKRPNKLNFGFEDKLYNIIFCKRTTKPTHTSILKNHL
jgi:hypothetical protein